MKKIIKKKIILFDIADLQEPNAHPALGLGFIKSYVLKNYRDNVDIDIVREDILKTIISEKPDLIGVSSVTQFYTVAIKFCKEIKKFFPETPIIIGGVHISTLPESINEVFDLGVIREGEITFNEIVGFLIEEQFKKSNLKVIAGLVWKEKGKIVVTGNRELLHNLDEIPHINRDDYTHKNFAHIITSRGCPYACAFCSSTHFWGTRKVRYHSARYIYEEIEILAKYGVKHISIWDDLFVFSISRLKDLIDLFKKNPNLHKQITFGCTARANVVTEELCLILKELNVKYVSMGLESGSDKVLEKIKGFVNVKENINAVQLMHKHGFLIRASFVINNPDETLEDLEKTYRFIKKIPLYAGDVYIAIPFPATPYWNYAVQEGLVSNDMDFGRLTIKNDIKNLKNNDFIKMSKDVSCKDIIKWGRLIQQELSRKQVWSLWKFIKWNIILIAIKNPGLAFRHIFMIVLDYLKRSK